MKKLHFWLLFTLITVLAIFLRFYKLPSFPPSLYWEEVALGYDAYSIAQTGKDHHGHSWPIVAFESFGDWKPALYFYTIVPFIKLVGLNAWAVRLPSAISGVAIVIGVGAVARFFATKKIKPDVLQLITMTIAAISPWAVQFSRAGWEVNLATALVLWGVIAFLTALHRKQRRLLWLLASVVLLVLGMYAYHAVRIIAPLLGMVLGGYWLFKKGIKNSWSLLAAGAAAIVLLIPLILSLGSKSTNQRFAETSIFSNVSVIERSNLMKERANNAAWARLFYHRYILFGREMMINALSHFHPNFLFVTGDANVRHSIQYMGQLYHIEVVFVVLGIAFIVFNWNSLYWLPLLWLAIGLLPASMTMATPHALRILPALPVFLIVISLGIIELVNLIPKKLKTAAVGGIVAMYLVEFVLFWHFYSTIYPKLYADQWQYGYQQMVNSLKNAQQQHPELPVYITREQGRPAMYYWFFTQTDPRQVQTQEATAKKDQGEFLEYQHIKFVNSVAEVIENEALVVSSVDEKDTLSARTEIISQIDDLRGKPVWMVYKVHKL